MLSIRKDDRVKSYARYGGAPGDLKRMFNSDSKYSYQPGGPNNGLGVIESSGKSYSDKKEYQNKKMLCSCKKSRCLKMYCECFAAGEVCYNCGCVGCGNTLENDDERQSAIIANREKLPLFALQKVYQSSLSLAITGIGCA